MISIIQRCQELGITLPRPAAPVADYVPFTFAGELLFISGQLPLVDGKLQYAGQVGAECSLEDARDAARLCAINCIAQAASALNDDMERIVSVVKLTGFVNAGAGFANHPKVVDGASSLMAEVFGEAGRHARAAVGCSSLPLNAPVEVEAIFHVRN